MQSDTPTPITALVVRTLLRAFGLFVLGPSACIASAQSTASDTTFDHEVLIERMRNAEDLLYREALHRYDTHVASHPQDIRIQLERCAFIGNALYEEYDDHNPNEEAFDSCLTALGEAYPDEPSVILARAAQRWSDEKIELLSVAEQRRKNSNIPWSDEQLAELHRELASALHYDERTEEALVHIEQAGRYRDRDRSSLLRAEILADMGRNDDALEALNLRLDTSEGAWNLQRRAELLLRLKDHQNALLVYREVERMDSTALDRSELARTLEEAGQFAMARSYLVRDTMKTWSTESAALALFEHDLRFQSGDTCLASYNALRDHGCLFCPEHPSRGSSPTGRRCAGLRRPFFSRCRVAVGGHDPTLACGSPVAAIPPP